LSPLATFRASVEAMVQAGIDLLDAMDAQRGRCGGHALAVLAPAGRV
jgi:hypothetical protein